MNTKTFTVEQIEYSLADMLTANEEDKDLCEWLTTAQVGESFPAFVECKRVS